MSEQAVVRVRPESPAALTRTVLDPQALIQSAVENGAGIETLERLVALAKDVRAQQAAEAWHVAMADFQRTCPVIRRSGTARITTAKGGYSYTYAPLAEIMSTVLPVLGPLGLSVSFRVRHEAQAVESVCRISHEMGHHEESGPVAIPIAADAATGANAAQRIGIASTYAKRYALLAILGLAPEDDPDGTLDKGGAQTGASTVRMPERKAAPSAPNADHTWTGTIQSVASKSGTTNGKAWTLHTITGTDGAVFGTFSDTHAAFARDEAGDLPVTITWKDTSKGGRQIVTLDPAHEVA